LGVNTVAGVLTNQPSAQALGRDFVEPLAALRS
jgi:hypothetical protein